MVRLLSDVVFIVKANSPYRKGVLQSSWDYNTLENGFEVFTDLDYMQYTEEAWTFNSRWGKTLQNPNEGWFERTVEEIAEYIAMEVGGVVVIE